MSSNREKDRALATFFDEMLANKGNAKVLQFRTPTHIKRPLPVHAPHFEEGEIVSIHFHNCPFAFEDAKTWAVIDQIAWSAEYFAYLYFCYAWPAGVRDFSDSESTTSSLTSSTSLDEVEKGEFLVAKEAQLRSMRTARFHVGDRVQIRVSCGHEEPIGRVTHKEYREWEEGGAWRYRCDRVVVEPGSLWIREGELRFPLGSEDGSDSDETVDEEAEDSMEELGEEGEGGTRTVAEMDKED